MPEHSRIKNFFTEHLLLKLLSLVLASMTIYGVRSFTSQTEDFEVPIIVKVDEGVAVLQQDAKVAYITCRGSYEDLRRLDVKELKVVVEPRNPGITAGERIPIGPGNVKGWTRGVKVVKVTPSVVFVNFDREISKVVAVAAPETVGNPLIGRAEVTYEPRVVTIRGPESRLADKKILRTEPVDVEGAVGSFNVRVNILTEGEAVVWHIEPKDVVAHINIVTESINKEWKNVKVLALVSGRCGMELSFSPEFVNVSLHGSPQSVNSIRDGDLNVFADCSDIAKSGVYHVPVAINLPPGLNLSAAIEPAEITVTAKPGAAVPAKSETERADADAGKGGASAGLSEGEPADEKKKSEKHQIFSGVTGSERDAKAE